MHGVVFDILVGSENHVGYLDVGYLDLEQKTLQPLDNPFSTRLSPMSCVRGVTYVSGLDKQHAGGRGGIRTHGTLAGTPVFKTGALNHSATLPNHCYYWRKQLRLNRPKARCY